MAVHNYSVNKFTSIIITSTGKQWIPGSLDSQEPGYGDWVWGLGTETGWVQNMGMRLASIGHHYRYSTWASYVAS